MTLVDAGPLVAILDRNDVGHRRCVKIVASLAAPLVTTWPAFTEAMYLVGQRGGWTAQEGLWRLVLRGTLAVHSLESGQLRRARELMRRYRDLPMDLADATLVAFAEAHRITQVFTLDKDFRVYRLHSRKAFDIVP